MDVPFSKHIVGRSVSGEANSFTYKREVSLSIPPQRESCSLSAIGYGLWERQDEWPNPIRPQPMILGKESYLLSESGKGMKTRK